MRREVRTLIDKALDSLVLSVEHFNRPWDRGRHEATLILLDRAFELLMKGALVHIGESIRDSPEANTYGFEKCLNKCVSGVNPPIMSRDEAVTARLINGLRDCAQHYILEVSEQQLYVYAQAGVTLFSDKLESVFEERLKDHLPERVLPVSTKAPSNLESIVSVDFAGIRALLMPGSRRQLSASSRLRSFAIMERALEADDSQPTNSDLNRLMERVKSGEEWQSLFPGIATMRLSTEGTGLNVSIRLTKQEGDPVRFVADSSSESEGVSLVAIKRVNEIDFYSMGQRQLADKLGVTEPKTRALIHHLNLESDPDCFRVIKVSKSVFKRYSPKALDQLIRALPEVDIAAVWSAYRQNRVRR